MAVGLLISLIAAGSAASAKALVDGARRARERRDAHRRISNVPEAHVGIAEGTVVRVTGTLQLVDEPLVAPLSGRPCVLYRTRTTVGVDGKRMSGVRTPVESFEAVRFAIDRGAAGVALIDATYALLDVPKLNLKHRDPDRERQFLARHGDHSFQPRRFEEVILEPGARLTIVGLAMLEAPREPTPDERGFRDGPAAQVRLVGDRAHPLAIGLAIGARPETRQPRPLAS